jgi:hypothetical protein
MKTLTKELIEKKRSPRELRSFVRSYKSEAEKIKEERHKAFKKKGLYKEFIDELTPLSIFCELYYKENNVNINLKLGNQTFDAEVTDEKGNLIEKIEITTPHNGKKSAKEYRQVIDKGFSDCTIYTPGSDLEKLKPIILKTAKKKAEKNYESCLLVIEISYLPPHKIHEKLYESKVEEVINEIKQISFNAKKVFILISNKPKIIEI